jgi:hypothetical protein
MPKHYIAPNLPPLRCGYRAISLFPTGIYYRSEEVRDDQTIRNHELIHWEQQKEMLCLLFYLWYLLEYLIKLIRFMDHHKAYRGIGFEQEAKKYESDPEYLSRRKPFHWFRFVLK